MPTQTEMMQVLSARQAATGEDASCVAEMAVAIWRDVDVALSPIIGQTGVAALFKRGVHLTRSTHPILATVLDDNEQSDEFAGLQAALARQTSAGAVAANLALLQSFQDLLISLIGLSLTERLLRPVWDKPSSGQTARDTVS